MTHRLKQWLCRHPAIRVLPLKNQDPPFIRICPHCQRVWTSR